MPANEVPGIADPAICKATWRPWPTISAPVLINFSFRLAGRQSLTGPAVAGVRGKLPGLQASASWGHCADAAAPVTIELLESIAALASRLVLIHVFRAKLARQWLAPVGVPHQAAHALAE
jgi:hypothetical protein